MTVVSATALRDDLERAIEEGIRMARQPRTIANRCIHLIILHGIIPETEN